MAIRWKCSACGLPMMNKDEEASLVSACPRCRHEELVPETSTREMDEKPERDMRVEMSAGERVMVNLGVWGLILLVILIIGGALWLFNMNFSAPDQMIQDGVGTFGNEHLMK